MTTVTLSETGDNQARGMEALLKEEPRPSGSLRYGDILEGTVMKVERDALLVDVGLKSEGIIPSYEMRSVGPDPAACLKPGDALLVYALGRSSREGQVLLSLDRTQSEKAWRTLEQHLQSGEGLEGKIVGVNRGGLLVEVDGIQGFAPLSQLAPPSSGSSRGKTLAERIGEKVKVKVLELNRRRQRVILSERAPLEEMRARQRDKLLEDLKEGQTRKGEVTSIHPFGVFVDLGGADGLIPLSELSWEKLSGPQDVVQEGDEVQVVVLRVDREARKIALSLKRTQPKPWDKILAQFQIGQQVKGVVTRLAPFGAFARVEGVVEGLIHLSELSDRRITHPKEVVKEGDVFNLKILSIEPERHRLALSLRQGENNEEHQP